MVSVDFVVLLLLLLLKKIYYIIYLKIFHFSPEYRNKIISEFKGNVSKLIQHTEARSVILEAYELLNAR